MSQVRSKLLFFHRRPFEHSHRNCLPCVSHLLFRLYSSNHAVSFCFLTYCLMNWGDACVSSSVIDLHLVQRIVETESFKECHVVV